MLRDHKRLMKYLIRYAFEQQSSTKVPTLLCGEEEGPKDSLGGGEAYEICNWHRLRRHPHQGNRGGCGWKHTA